MQAQYLQIAQTKEENIVKTINRLNNSIIMINNNHNNTFVFGIKTEPDKHNNTHLCICIPL